MRAICVQGGRGGQKRPKNCVHTISMAPYTKFPEVLRMLWWIKEYLIEEHFYVKGSFKLHFLGSVQAS